MATKDSNGYCKDLSLSFNNSNNHDSRYKNLNLNQNNQHFNNNGIGQHYRESSSKLEHRSGQSYDTSNSPSKFNGKMFNFKSRSTSLNNFKSEYSKKEDDKMNKGSLVDSKLSFSLHVEAYENNATPSKENPTEKLKLTKNWKTFKPVVPLKKNPFEFPRQKEEDKINDPEVMQFKASQQLLNPSSSTTSPPAPAPLQPEGNVIMASSDNGEQQHTNVEQRIDESPPPQLHHYHQQQALSQQLQQQQQQQQLHQIINDAQQQQQQQHIPPPPFACPHQQQQMPPTESSNTRQQIVYRGGEAATSNKGKHSLVFFPARKANDEEDTRYHGFIISRTFGKVNCRSCSKLGRKRRSGRAFNNPAWNIQDFWEFLDDPQEGHLEGCSPISEAEKIAEMAKNACKCSTAANIDVDLHVDADLGEVENAGFYVAANGEEDEANDDFDYDVPVSSTPLPSAPNSPRRTNGQVEDMDDQNNPIMDFVDHNAAPIGEGGGAALAAEIFVDGAADFGGGDGAAAGFGGDDVNAAGFGVGGGAGDVAAVGFGGDGVAAAGVGGGVVGAGGAGFGLGGVGGVAAAGNGAGVGGVVGGDGVDDDFIPVAPGAEFIQDHWEEELLDNSTIRYWFEFDGLLPDGVYPPPQSPQHHQPPSVAASESVASYVEFGPLPQHVNVPIVAAPVLPIVAAPQIPNIVPPVVAVVNDGSIDNDIGRLFGHARLGIRRNSENSMAANVSAASSVQNWDPWEEDEAAIAPVVPPAPPLPGNNNEEDVDFWDGL